MTICGKIPSLKVVRASDWTRPFREALYSTGTWTIDFEASTTGVSGMIPTGAGLVNSAVRQERIIWRWVYGAESVIEVMVIATTTVSSGTGDIVSTPPTS